MSESNQYTNTRVESKDFTSGWLVAILIAGTGLTLPILYLGSEIALAIGFKKALMAFGISTAVLTLMCMATTVIGNRSRLSTYMILHFSFGKNGAKIMNLIFGIILLGWFSVALELLAVAVQDTAMSTMALQLPQWPIIFIISTIISATTLYGIKSLEKLANIAVPILTAFLVFASIKSLAGSHLSSIFAYEVTHPTMSLFQATSILVGSSILFPVLMADFSRFIHNDKQSLVAVLGITIGFPIALLLSAIPSIQTGEVDIIKVMENLNLTFPAFILLFVSTWVGNASNLYSTALTFSTIKSSWTYKKIVIISATVGTLLALLGVTQHLFVFLDFLGIFSPAISSIYIINFFWVRKQNYDLEAINKWESPALISWGASSLITVFTYLDIFQLTHVYFVDSLLLGAIFYLLLIKLKNHKANRLT